MYTFHYVIEVLRGKFYGASLNTDDRYKLDKRTIKGQIQN